MCARRRSDRRRGGVTLIELVILVTSRPLISAESMTSLANATSPITVNWSWNVPDEI